MTGYNQAAGWWVLSYLLWLILYLLGMGAWIHGAIGNLGGGWIRVSGYIMAWFYLTLWPLVAADHHRKLKRERLHRWW